MASIRFKRFTKPHVLKDIGRALLGRFFAKFKDDLAEKEVTLPDPALADEEYFGTLADVLLSPEGLPGTLNDALYAIDEMATEDGQQRLEEGVAEARDGDEVFVADEPAAGFVKTSSDGAEHLVHDLEALCPLERVDAVDRDVEDAQLVVLLHGALHFDLHMGKRGQARDLVVVCRGVA